MSLQAVILWGLKISVVLSVFAMGLDFSAQKMMYLVRYPLKLVRSLVVMDIVMPIFAMMVAALFPLPAPVKIALVALSVSPTPPRLPGKAIKLGGTETYVVGLLVAVAVTALFFVPLSVWLLGAIWGVHTHMHPKAIALILGTTIFVPLAVAVLLRRFWPDQAKIAFQAGRSFCHRSACCMCARNACGRRMARHS